MTRAVLLVVPGVAVLAAWLAGGRVWSVVVAAVLGLLAGGALYAVQAGRARRFARRVNRWAGEGMIDTLDSAGGGPWRELSTAVNAIGAQLREARDELRSTVPWTERLVASLDEPALVFGPDGRLVAANDAAAPSVATGDPELAPTPVAALGSSATAQAVEEAARSGHLVSINEDRAGRYLRVTASPLDDHVLVVISDRTRERQIEALRRDFVINASHELKTPVTAIRALVEALEVAPEDRRAGLVHRLDDESERLAKLVHDLLDLRMLDEAGDVERTAVDLVELVGSAVAAVGEAATRKDVGFELDLPERAVVAGERRDLALVVDNLVENAVQYNVAGGQVVIGLRADDGAQVLTVQDTGIGIPSHATDRIFERFYRVDEARSRDRGGTGLGLSIVRHAVERHGGRVTVASLLGDGTTFTVRLPVEPPA